VRRRLRDIGDARTELEDLSEGRSQPPVEPGLPDAARGWRRGAPAAVLLACLAGGIAIGVFAASSRARPAGDGVRRYELTSPGFELRVAPGRQGMDLAVTPDGRRVVYVGESDGASRLYVRDVDRLEPRVLAGLVSPQNPFLSADGRWVGFLEGSELKKINIDGGPVVTIANVGATSLQGASWGADDLIVFNTNASNDLLRIPADGGAIEVLATPDRSAGEAGFRYPDVLPDGRTVLFTVIDTSGSIENAQLVAMDLDSRARTVLVRGAGQARYVPTGRLVFGIDGELRAVGFSAATLEVAGTPVSVVDGVATTELGGANFDVAADGTLVYVAGGAVEDRNELVWVDRQGGETVLRAGVRAFRQARVSPDGTRLAVDIREQQNDIWIWEFASETLTRLTVDPLSDRQPIWSPDARYVVFSSDRTGSVSLFRMLADGTGEPEQLTDGPGFPYATSFTPDGARLVYWQTSPQTGLDLGLLTLDGDRSPTALLATGFDERNAEVSPDGRWLAYQSNDSGRNEVYVLPFPDVESGRWKVSGDGGTRPMWRPDGRELFYWNDDRLMVIPVEVVAPGAPFPRASPRMLFEWDYAPTLNSRTFDVAPDGERFLMIRSAGGEDASRRAIVLVQHWFDELRARVPAGG